jgi:hypothetical protein
MERRGDFGQNLPDPHHVRNLKGFPMHPSFLIGNYETNCQRRTKISLAPMRCSLRKFQRRRAFIVPLPSDKRKMTIKKVHCDIGSRFEIFHRTFANLCMKENKNRS